MRSGPSPAPGLPAIERGMPLPAGTGMSRRTFVARSVGLALSVYGAGRLGSSTRASRPRRPSAQVADPRHRVPAGRGRLDVAALSGRRPAVPEVPPEARGHGRRGFHRGHASVLAPGACAARRTPRRGQGLGAAGRRLRPSRPVALHLAPFLGGRRDRRAAADRLDGPLPRRRRPPDNPLQGLSITGSLQPSLATTRVPVAAIDGPDQYDFWVLRRLGLGAGSDARRGRWPRPRQAARPGSPVGRERDRAGRSSAPAARAVRGQGPEAGGAVPGRERLVPEAPAGARRDDLRGPAAALRRARSLRLVRHARRPDLGARRPR